MNEQIKDAVPAIQEAAPKESTVAMFNLDSLLTHWNVMLIVAVWTGIQAVRRALPNEWFDEGKPLARLLPLAPIIVCNAAVWVPGPWMNPSETWGQRLMLGTVLGFATANIHTIANRLGVHQLLRVEADTRKLPRKKHKPEAEDEPPAENESETKP